VELLAVHPTSPPVVLGDALDERPARATLRAQIARLERELAGARDGGGPGDAAGPAAAVCGGPRLLTLGELERVRDELAERAARRRRELAARAREQAAKRRLLERMRQEPARHRWARVTSAELGEPGCAAYHVLPRLGPIGLLAGWWRVKVSSGCPLPRGRAGGAAPRSPIRPPATARGDARAPGGRRARRAGGR
jgi:hypothetical protein